MLRFLTDFERIGDHGLNIAESLYHIQNHETNEND